MRKEGPQRGGAANQGAGGGAALSLQTSSRTNSGSTETKLDRPHTATGVHPPSAPLSCSQWLLSFRAGLQKAMDADNVRTMTIQACRESILAAYDSKAAAAARAVARGNNLHGSPSSAPAYHTDTMEMHVYRGLEKKYGLRSLAVDHAAMLLISVRLYADTDTDVELFYKIFRNDVEEEFRLVQNELKKSIKDLLMVQLMNKYAACYHHCMLH